MSNSVEGLSRPCSAEFFKKDSSIQWVSRSLLPAKSAKADFNVWSFVKQCIGKDLTKVSMPVALNEPLSFLQRVAEYMEYSELLTEAAKQTDPIRRMEYMCAFAVSATSSNHNRIGKPFNPLLGETYEFHHNNFVLVAEQVSHHPPVTAVHVESEEYCLWSTVQFKLRFWGKSLEVQPKGFVNLKLLKHKETYTWQHPNLVIHNLLMGKLWLEHVGHMTVTNHSSGLQCQLEFQPLSWFTQQANQVVGQLLNSDGSVVRQIFGNWTRGLFSVEPQIWNERHLNGSSNADRSNSLATQQSSCKQSYAGNSSAPGSPSNSAGTIDSQVSQLGFDIILPTQQCLWLANPRPVNAADYYNFTHYALGLNELTDGLASARCDRHCSQAPCTSPSKPPFLPPTDCRFRPDIRALESGQLELAAREKDRLEQKQRQAMKHGAQAHRPSITNPLMTMGKLVSDRNRSTNPTPEPPSNHQSTIRQIGPIWFKQAVNDITNQDEWLFTGTYWRRDWSKCPDLY